MSNNKNTSSYLQGYTRLIADATIGITDLVETMHKRVVHPPFLPSTPIQHLITSIAGITYKNIRWSTKLISRSLDNVLGKLAPVLGEIKSTDKKEAISSALNGVVGDYLEEKENPLKITMQFRHMSEAIQLDSRSIDEVYDDAISKLNELFKTHDIAIMVGGSGLYVDAVTKGLDYFPAVDSNIRENLNQKLETEGKIIQDSGEIKIIR